MKLILNIVAILMIVVVSGSAQIRNSKHDLSFTSTATTKTTSSSYTEVCVFCHTPHSSGNTSLLWNRTYSNATYQVYSSPTMEQAIPQPGGVSKNCLSCHDGTVALASVVNNPGSSGGIQPVFSGTGMIDTTGFTGLGMNLTNDHPISFVYNTSQATDPDLRAATVTGNKVAVSNAGTSLTLYGTTAATATLECGTCHDPHGVSGVPTFLRASNDASALCFTCHIK